MAKVTLTDLANISGAETTAIAAINANNTSIETAIENTISRDGTAPNAMNADFDMNGYDILNAGAVDVESLTVGGVDVASIVGETGPQGEQGETGPQGEQGEQGEQGPAGADGDNVVWIAQAGAPSDLNDGEDGDMYLNTSNGDVYGPKAAGAWGSSIANIIGPEGPAGAGSGDMLAATYDPQNIMDDAFDRANHTGTQTASTISDFDTEVSNNADVAANTAARHDAVTVTDSSEINFTLTGQDITASLIAASIDESKLDASVNASLDLADSSLQDADIGVSVQAYSANLDEYAAVNPTAAGLALLDDANAAAQLVTLGLTATAAELNILDGATLTVTELNYVDGVTSSIQTQLDGKQATITGLTASGAELNILDGATLTTTELNYVDGVTSAIQTQLDGKQATITGLTASGSELNILDGATLTTTELNYVDGVTSAIQTQLDGKQPLDADLTSWAGVTRAANFDTFVATPSSANLRALLTDEVGTGSAYFVGGALGTPASGTLTNATGLPLSSGVTGQLPLANGGTGANLSDPGADRIVFWDDSAGAITWLSASTGLTISGTSISTSSSVALLDTADQTITGGARVTTNDLGNLSGATITPDPGDRPIQKITNNGAGTIAPGSNQGSYLLVVKNTTGAGAITTSGWSLVTGDSFGTATTAEYLCHCTVVGDFSCMIITEVTA